MMQKQELAGEDFGAMIRAARKKKGLRQEDVARETGIPISTYRAYERGDIEGVPRDRATRILKVLGIQEGQESPRPEPSQAGRRRSVEGKRRNIGIAVRNADTGEIWFAVEFPDYLPVFNRLEIVVRPKADFDDVKPDS